MGFFDNEIQQYFNSKHDQKEDKWLVEWEKKYGNCVFPLENYFVKTYKEYIKNLIHEYIEAMKETGAYALTHGFFISRRLYGLPGGVQSFVPHVYYAVDEKEHFYFVSLPDVSRTSFDKYLETLHGKVSTMCGDWDLRKIWEGKIKKDVSVGWSDSMTQEYLEALDEKFHVMIEYLYRTEVANGGRSFSKR